MKKLKRGVAVPVASGDPEHRDGQFEPYVASLERVRPFAARTCQLGRQLAMLARRGAPALSSVPRPRRAAGVL